jgi:hypothetical protein
MIKAWAKFTAVRAQARAQVQSSPLASALEEYFASAPFKAAVAEIIRGAFADGVVAEKARIEAILTVPGAAIFPDLAADLVRGPATSAQAIQILERAEADAATRAATIKSNMVESANAPTRH